MQAVKQRPTIFVSYSHKDQSWFDRVLAHLNSMGEYWRIDAWTDKSMIPGLLFRPQIFRAMDNADAAILLVSANFLSSQFIQQHEVPHLRHLNTEYNIKVVPIILSPCGWELDPFIKDLEKLPKEGAISDLIHQSEQESAILNSVAAILDSLDPQPRKPGTPLPPRVYNRDHVPTYSEVLIGREKELDWLDQTWDDTSANVAALIAWGGAGKTSIAKRWAISTSEVGGRGAQAIWGWSFYNQGTKAREQNSSAFFHAACDVLSIKTALKDEDLDRAKRLADWCAKTRALLVIDGVEPLQNPPGIEGDQFRFSDAALKHFILAVTHQNRGLALVTTRFPLVDLSDHHGPPGSRSSYRVIELEALSPPAGADLLRRLKVEGEQKDLEDAVEGLEGHCLSITLLAGHLTDHRHGRIEAWLEDRDLFSTDGQGGAKHAWRVLQAYDREWLSVGLQGTSSIPRKLMLTVGLFDRPVQLGLITSASPAGDRTLLNELAELQRSQLNVAIAQLRSGHLLAAASTDARSLEELDCHPLVREWFGNKFREEDKHGWEAANSAVFDKLVSSNPPVETPTKADLGELYQAIPHGVKAGRAQEVFHQLFRTRMRKGTLEYTVNQLGLWSEDLQAIAAFFQGHFDAPVEGLSTADVVWLQNEAAFCLRSIGRLADAAARWEAALIGSGSNPDVQVLANIAGHLADVRRFLGPMRSAFEAGTRAVEFSRESGNLLQEGLKRTSVAAALHMLGSFTEAEREYRTSEAQEKQADPTRSLMRSRRAYHFADLLLDLGKLDEVQRRANSLKVIEDKSGTKLDQALARLILARMWLRKCQPHGIALLPRALNVVYWMRLRKAERFANDALKRVGDSKDYIYTCISHVTRAELRIEQRRFDLARSDLLEARKYIDRGAMALLDVDAKLVTAQLALSQSTYSPNNADGTNRSRDVGEAIELITDAKKLAARIGYRRRDRQIEELATRLR